MKTRQIVFTKPYTAELLEVECPAPQKDELCVRIEYSAISSGTERANYVGDRNRTTAAEDAEATFPRTVGYSAAGVITELGEGITDLCVGDRVIVYWGSHQRNITVKRTNVVKIPDSVLKLGAMAFYNCSELKYFEVGAQLEFVVNTDGTINKAESTIGEYALYRFHADIEIVYPENSGMEVFYAFYRLDKEPAPFVTEAPETTALAS